MVYICEKAKQVLIEKLKKEKEETKQSNADKEYWINKICPCCGSTNIELKRCYRMRRYYKLFCECGAISQEFEEAVKSFKKILEITPDDLEVKLELEHISV